MEQVFIEHLDQLYWQGYRQQFKEDNPDAFNRQLAEFAELHSIRKRIPV